MAERVSAFTRVSLLIIGLLGLGELPVAASPIVVATTLADELRITIPDPPIDYAGPVFFNFDITGLDAGERLQVHAGQLLGGGSGIVDLALHLVVGGVYVPIPAIGFGATPIPQLSLDAPGDVNLVNLGMASIFLYLTGPAGATAEFNRLVVTGQTVQGTQQSQTVVAAAVPEPASMLLVGTGVTLLAAARRRKSRLTRAAS